jgi:hypothetical protein
MIDKEGITVTDLRSIHPFPQQYRDTCIFVSQIKKHYCPFMVSNRKCDRMCAVTCAENIRSLVSDFKGDVDRPVGLLIWRIRNLRAKLSEQWSAERKEPIGRNMLGEVVSRNPFEALRISGD